MKKLTFVMSLLMAVLVMGVTSCKSSDKDEPFNPAPTPVVNSYNGTISIYLMENPGPDDAPDQVINNQDVKVTILPWENKLYIAIDDLQINIPPIVATTDISIMNIPYTPSNGAYNVAFNGHNTISFLGTTADVQRIDGTITNTALPITVFAVGSEELLNMPVTIVVDATALPQ